MQCPDDVDFKTLFESCPQLFLVLSPDLNIVAASDAYLAATMTDRTGILGRNIFDVFPSNPADPTGDGTTNLAASLQSVLQNKASNSMAVQKYDIPRSQTSGGGFEERYWSPVNSPVFDKDGNVKYILHRAEDVTEFIYQQKQRLLQSELTEELSERAQDMEREIYLRAQEIQERNKQVESLNEDLRKSHAEALAASKIKSEFLANMSHEIRTPMNAILGMSEIILNSELDPRIREYVAVIKEAGSALLELVSDILDFSKVESGKLTLEEIDYSPVLMIESISALMQPQAAKKGLSLGTKIEQSLPGVLRGDPVRLRQVLLNLVGNAIKFSPHGDVLVTVNVVSQGDNKVRVRFAVKDQGIGMSSLEIEKLYQPFVQGDGTITRKFGGTGLGLSISKRIIDLMGGAIGVESELGSGSSFWFEVEQTVGQLAHLSLMPGAGERQTQSRVEVKADLSLLSAPDQVRPKRPELILVVDDHPVNQQVAVLLLLNLGFESHVAANGLEALKCLERTTYSLVFMDVQMPVLNGFEATRMIRKSELDSGKHVPVIGMTAYALEGSKEACIASGMDSYLSKPIDPVLLGSLLNQYLPGMVEATAAVAPLSNAVCLDPVNFDSLRKRYGEENVAIFLDLFLQDTPVRLALLQKAFKESELEIMLDTVHCLKGSSASVFAPGLRRICESIEADLRDNGISSNVECFLAEIFAEFEKIQTYVMSQRSLAG